MQGFQENDNVWCSNYLSELIKTVRVGALIYLDVQLKGKSTESLLVFKCY